MNQSARTLSDLERFARRAPRKANEYLEQVESNLRALGQMKKANAVAKVLSSKAGTLAERIERHSKALGVVFPAEATDWGAVQLSRADTIGFDTKPASRLPLTLHGTLAENDAGEVVLETDGGQTLRLHDSELLVPDGGLSASRLRGFIGDGPVTIVGTPGEDLHAFNVEGFALNTDGAFDTLTFGRVKTDGSGHIATRRGDVAVTNPRLLEKLKVLPRLGIILPGEPTRSGTKFVYENDPKEFFALARFQPGAVEELGATHRRLADMAFNTFDDRPVHYPANTEQSRLTHADRLWLRGDLKTDDNGGVRKFVASYVSKSVDGAELPAATASADPVQVAVVDEIV